MIVQDGGSAVGLSYGDRHEGSLLWREITVDNPE